MAVVFAAVVFISLHRWSGWDMATPCRRRRLSPCRLFGQPDRRPGLLSLRANFERRPSVLNGAVLIFCWPPCRRRSWIKSWTWWTNSRGLPLRHLEVPSSETQTLSDHEKLEILYKSELLGGRKPSQMLASMLAYCPAGMEQTIMFQFLFLLRLPVTLRTLLGEQEPGDIRSLAARADRLWATHRPQSHDVVANVDAAEEQPAQITAVQKKEPSQKKKFGKKFGGRSLAAAGGQATSSSSSGSGSGSGPGGLIHSEQARVGSGLCYFHWTHGVKASKCVAPCSWTGN
jgi:hypothetical protein